MTTKRLSVSIADPYTTPNGERWLRLRVENPTAMPIPNCYGKLVSRKVLISPPLEEQVSPDKVHMYQELLNEGLPPEGHLFLWDDGQPRRRIPGNKSPVFLRVVVVKKPDDLYFYVEREHGPEYRDVAGNRVFEWVIEVGSETEAFQQTKVRLIISGHGNNFAIKELEEIS